LELIRQQALAWHAGSFPQREVTRTDIAIAAQGPIIWVMALWLHDDYSCLLGYSM